LFPTKSVTAHRRGSLLEDSQGSGSWEVPQWSIRREEIGWTSRLPNATDEFVKCRQPGDRHNRKATWSEENPDGRWKCYTHEEIINRDKASLGIFWLRDERLEDSANLPDPHILAAEIAEDLESALDQIKGILGDLEERVDG